MNLLFLLFLIIVTMLIIWKASDWFETASDYLWRNLSEWVKWATINAIASSLPELFTTLFFLFYLNDVDWISWGIWTTAGSAIFNWMIIPALVILVVVVFRKVKGVSVSKKVILRDWIALILSEAVLVFLISWTTLQWRHWFILMLMYICYIIYTLTSMKSNNIEESNEDEDEDEIIESKSKLKALFTLDLAYLVIWKWKINKTKSIVLLSISVIIIAVSCMLLVYTCEWIWEVLWIPIIFVSVVLAAAASSVPDTIISMKDAKKWNYDDAVSNALWSNIFDICFALWAPLFLYTLINWPITMNLEAATYSFELRLFLLVLTVITFFRYLFSKKMWKLTIIFLLAMYWLFLIYVFYRVQL